MAKSVNTKGPGEVNAGDLVTAVLRGPEAAAALPDGVDVSIYWEEGGPRYTVWIEADDWRAVEVGDLTLTGWIGGDGRWQPVGPGAPAALRAYFDANGYYRGPDRSGRYPILEPAVRPMG